MDRRLKVAVAVATAALPLAYFAASDQAAARSKGACTREYRPVCALARSGVRKTYANACMARSAGARILHPGRCFGEVCTMIYDPVCARDRKGMRRTYPSLCVASNAGAAFIAKGECR